jgi:hypothetical protein
MEIAFDGFRVMKWGEGGEGDERQKVEKSSAGDGAEFRNFPPTMC